MAKRSKNFNLGCHCLGVLRILQFSVKCGLIGVYHALGRVRKKNLDDSRPSSFGFSPTGNRPGVEVNYPTTPAMDDIIVCAGFGLMRILQSPKLANYCDVRFVGYTPRRLIGSIFLLSL